MEWISKTLEWGDLTPNKNECLNSLCTATAFMPMVGGTTGRIEIRREIEDKRKFSVTLFWVNRGLRISRHCSSIEEAKTDTQYFFDNMIRGLSKAINNIELKN
jgi:hypothetical protein